MLLINCEDIRNTNYTLQETAEFLHVTAGHMHFIAGLGKCRIFLSVLLTWFTESVYSSCTKNCVMKKIISLIVIFSIYCGNRMEHKNTVRIKMQGFFMLQLVVLTFITALRKDIFLSFLLT
jgi:hypothetical protein